MQNKSLQLVLKSWTPMAPLLIVTFCFLQYFNYLIQEFSCLYQIKVSSRWFLCVRYISSCITSTCTCLYAYGHPCIRPCTENTYFDMPCCILRCLTNPLPHYNKKLLIVQSNFWSSYKDKYKCTYIITFVLFGIHQFVSHVIGKLHNRYIKHAYLL